MNLKYQGSYIENQFILSEKGIRHSNINPFNLKTPHFEWMEDTHLARPSVDAAKRAHPAWAALSLEERAKYLANLKASFQKHAQELEDSIILEMGKARWEAKQEVSALSSKIDITLSTMIPAMKSLSEIASTPGESELRFTSRGPTLVIGPFNFPLHLPNGHIIPSLLAGNTVIFKPSETAPATASLYARCFQEAQFPSGVFQMLLGGAQTAERLLEAQEIEAIYFTGSYAVGKLITEKLLRERHHLDTLAALELGGKNATIVHSDADLSKALYEVITSAYATAGQRCSSTSRLLVHESLADQFQSMLLKAIPQIKIGNPLDTATFMGPLVHEKALQGFLKQIARASDERLEILIPNQRISETSCLLSPSLMKTDSRVALKSSLFKEELFGPNMIMVSYSDFDELVELHESTDYGLVASVFSKSRDFYEKLQKILKVGLLNWNRGTIGASSKLPFGGLKKSGNNWPAGMFSFLYCIRPESCLYEGSSLDLKKVPEPLRSLQIL